jgi:aspartate dehydrogenase
MKVGILGYGNLGKYLCEKIMADSNFELVYVWNRSEITDTSLNKSLILSDINDFYKQ